MYGDLIIKRAQVHTLVVGCIKEQLYEVMICLLWKVI